jgi:two-component system chemotaxis response regulator CheB
MNRVIRTLIVDDSAFVRKVVREMLSRSPYIEVVGAARDGNEALELVEQLKPDVVTCDLVMPRMDGIEFIREQMRRDPLPILVLTSLGEDAEKALVAMEAGAVDIVQKPTALANERLMEIQEALVEKIKAVAQTPHANLLAPKPQRQIETMRGGGAHEIKIVVIGISTGGPQALRFMLPQLPSDLPVPVAIVLHMPLGYIGMFAEKLNEISQVEVREVQDGEKLQAGVVYLAQAGRHLLLRLRSDSTVAAELSLKPMDVVHRPAADILFQSAADCFGSGVLGVVMTGMGDDGKKGAAWIKAKGGTVLTEAEESCVIYGMPRSVTEAGLSDGAVPLEKMAERILEIL